MLQRFLSYIQQQQLFFKEDRLLLAVSGGMDSVALCELCHKAGFHFAIAHCNFKLRGAESDRDEQFVQQLAARYGVPFFVTAFDTEQEARLQKKSIETMARELRYAWFYQLMKAQGFTRVLTAHHADDNIETVLMHFFRGTGIAGLRGMLPVANQLARPLLFATRKEIEAFVEAEKLAFVTDSSNASSEYTRNFFRNEVLPQIARVYPSAAANITANIKRFTEVELLYREAIAMHRKKLVQQKGQEWHIPVLKLKQWAVAETVLFEILQPLQFTAAQVPEVLALLESETGKYVQSVSHRVIKNRQWLIIAPLATEAAGHVLIEAEESIVHFAEGKLTFRLQNDVVIDSSPAVAMLDAALIKYPLLLRRWKQGDYFYPLGMPKKKKLSRFLIDQKLSLADKEKVWVLEMNKKIIWVVGWRIDNRFKLTASTRQALHLAYLPK